MIGRLLKRRPHLSKVAIIGPLRFKLVGIVIFAIVTATACMKARPTEFVIGESKAYEASLFRQNCAVCHGSEANGKILDDGRVVPSLRTGPFKKRSPVEIQNQIAAGGNGMTPFRGQLTDREIEQLTTFILRDLRGAEK